MTEQAPNHIDENDKRPFGRFLLSQDREQTWRREAYSYARNFAERYADQLRPKGSSFVAVTEIQHDGAMTLPINTPEYDKSVWLDFVQNSEEPGNYLWRLFSKGEEYDLNLGKDSYDVTKCEINAQGYVFRRQVITERETIEGLQSILETMIEVAKIDERIVQHREGMKHAEQQLKDASDQPSSPRQQKEKAAFHKAATQLFFQSGSIGHRQ